MATLKSSNPKRGNIRQEIASRFFRYFLVMTLICVLLFFAEYRIIFIRGNELREEAKNTYIKERSVEAPRGNIYSSDGSLLATSLPKYRLGMDPSVFSRTKEGEEFFSKNIDGLAKSLAEFYKDHDANYYKNRIVNAKKKNRHYVLINNRLLDYQQRKKVMNFPLFKDYQHNPMKTGLVFDQYNVRYAPFGQLAYRTIGYLKDKVAVGLEGSFDKELRGTPGTGLFEKMDKNTWRPMEGGDQHVPIPGYDLISTIDINIQDMVEAALMRALENYKGDYATAVVMETKTGKIKAISNLSANPNSPTGYSEFENHAITTPNDPGSVFKLPSMMAILEETDYSLDRVVEVGPARANFYGRYMTDSHGMGTVPLRKIIESSSNIGTMKLMQEVFISQPAKFFEYLKKFHLTESIDFQIQSPNAKPKFPPFDKWTKIQLLWSSVGYSTNYIPIQLLAFYNAIANDGYWIQPIIVESAVSGNEVKIDYTQTQIRDKERICSEKTLNKIREMLVGVVQNGTGNNIKNAYYGIAGKTGTAQRLVDGRYIKGTYYVSFIGYFPADNPRYTMLVAINNPKGNSETTYARQVTAPVFKEIADRIYARDVDLQKSLNKVLPDSLNKDKVKAVLAPKDQMVLLENLNFPKHQEDGSWIVLEKNKQEVSKNPLKNPVKTVPNVVGMNLRDAIYLLENKDIKVIASGYGKVKEQSIEPGTSIEKNMRIQLTLN